MFKIGEFYHSDDDTDRWFVLMNQQAKMLTFHGARGYGCLRGILKDGENSVRLYNDNLLIADGPSVSPTNRIGKNGPWPKEFVFRLLESELQLSHILREFHSIIWLDRTFYHNLPLKEKKDLIQRQADACALVTVKQNLPVGFSKIINSYLCAHEWRPLIIKDYIDGIYRVERRNEYHKVCALCGERAVIDPSKCHHGSGLHTRCSNQCLPGKLCCFKHDDHSQRQKRKRIQERLEKTRTTKKARMEEYKKCIFESLTII